MADGTKEIYRDTMFYRFALYGFLKNLKFYEVFIVLYFLSVGLSYTAIGALVAVQMLSVTLLELPTGVFADIFGRRKSMVMSFFSYIVAFLLLYAFTDFYVLALAMFLYGMGDAFRTGTHKALILEYLRSRGMLDMKVDYYGHTRAASQFGSAVNALLAAAVVFYTGDYRTVFLFAIVPYLIDAFNVGTYPRELDGHLEGRGSLAERAKATAVEFRVMLASASARRAILNSSSYDAAFEVAKGYLQPVLKALALSLAVLSFLGGRGGVAVTVGVVYFLIYIMASLSSMKSSSVVKKLGRLDIAINRTYLLSAVLIALAGVSLHLCHRGAAYTSLAVFLFLLLYIVKNLRRPMNVAKISDSISHRAMASGLSVDSLTQRAIAAVLAPTVGLVADYYGIGMGLMTLSVVLLALYAFARVSMDDSG